MTGFGCSASPPEWWPPMLCWLDSTSPRRTMVLAGQLVKRFGSIDDLVGMALLLCSDDARFMTGQTVVVDGGYVRRL